MKSKLKEKVFSIRAELQDAANLCIETIESIDLIDVASITWMCELIASLNLTMFQSDVIGLLEHKDLAVRCAASYCLGKLSVEIEEDFPLADLVRTYYFVGQGNVETTWSVDFMTLNDPLFAIRHPKSFETLLSL